jgi:murein DD-endopeptidase MepM/ murein hydrolase activator NlpD
VYSYRHYPLATAFLLALLVLALVQAAHANTRVTGDVQFFPLDGVRNNVPQANSVTKRATPQVLRSDRKALESGFFRIDRDRVMRRDAPRVARPATPELAASAATDVPRITRGSAVVDLFGEGDAENPVFGETLRGGYGNRSPATRAGHIWPIAGTVKQKVSSGYGMRKDPFHGRPAFHGGIDIAAAPGTPIQATAAGVVAKTGTGRGYGNYVLIAHPDGSETRYSHLSASTVRAGQRVMQGQMVGRLGSTGRSTGPHLDYRIRKNGQRLDPLAVVRAPAGMTTTRVAQVIRVR